MVKIAVAGSCGRMGKNICRLVINDEKAELSAAFERESHPDIGKDIGEVLGIPKTNVLITEGLDAEAKVDVMIDFTCAEATAANIDLCSKKGINMVIGTTALTSEQEEKMAEKTDNIAIVYSPNMAVGVNVLFEIIRKATTLLKDGFEISVDETHHVHKKDAPSGTAKMIAKVISDELEKDVPIDASREGEVIGFHRAVFESELEKLTISHEAKERSVFAGGAIKAAKYIAGKKTGLFNMKNVLGIEKGRNE